MLRTNSYFPVSQSAGARCWWLAIVFVMLILLQTERAQAQFTCVPSSTGPVCTNSGTVTVTSGFGSTIDGFRITGDGTIINSGSVTAAAGGGSIVSGLTVTGNGSISSPGNVTASAGSGSIVTGVALNGNGSVSTGNVTVTAGTGSIITGVTLGGTGSVTSNNVTVSAGDGSIVTGIGSGTGTITVTGNVTATAGNGAIVNAVTLGQGSIINSGSITATGGIGSLITAVTLNGANSSLINSGAIRAFGPNAVALSLTGNSDTLTLLPGSFIIGKINLGGTNDTINMLAGNQNLTFNTLTGTTVLGTVPFVVVGSRIVSIDPTSFATAGSALSDFARSVSAIIPDVGGVIAPGGAGVTAFAGPDSSSAIDDAFASLTGVSAYAGDRMVFKNPTAVYADGFTVWGRGFGGRHIQSADGVLQRNVSSWYGGAIGVDKLVRPDLRLGVFVGGGATRNSIDPNSTVDTTDSTIGFGGAYARYTVGASFLNAAIQGGTLHSTTGRLINNNLLANGLETATAAYNGWYISPELKVGHRIALGQFADSQYALTPSLQVRYLYAGFDGYTETGTTNAPLTVASRNTENVEERAELKLTRTTQLSPTSQLMFNLTGGVLGVQRVGGNAVNATLLALPIAFNAPGSNSVWGGFGGLGIEWQMRNVSVFAAGEYLAWQNAGSIVSGRGGIRVGF